jgi:hypothetical protein
MEATIDMLIGDMVSSSNDKDDERDEKNGPRWMALLDKAEHKIKLKEAKVEAAKVASQATLIHAMNDSSEAAVTKMKEDSKILIADTATMDDDAKAWYQMARLTS